jgi:hypothetical protein
MTTDAWRFRDPCDNDIDWRPVRAGGAVVAGLVKLGRSTLVYTYDPRLASLDGARFASAAAARAAVDTALAAPAPKQLSVPPLEPAARRHRRIRQTAAGRHGSFYDG